MEYKIKKSFNHNIGAYNRKAAEIIVPMLIKLIRPKNIIDIGCGTGTWLYVFNKCGIEDYLGVDGDYVDRRLLYCNITEEHFYPFDLISELNLYKKYDLAISLEVAEHINETHAEDFVKTLINHSNTVVFSAAIPFQNGENHKNEQWLSYWIKKFEKHNYFPHDIIRPYIWDNGEIEFWYKQNIIVFKKGIKSDSPILDLVHPSLYLLKTNYLLNEIKSIKEGRLGLRFYIKIVFKIVKIKIVGLWQK